MNPIRLLPLAALALLPCFPMPQGLLLSATGTPPGPLLDQELARLAPERCLAYVELGQLDEVLGAGLEHPLARAVLSSDLGAGLSEALGSSPAAALAALDEQAGYEVLPALASVGSKGAALAIGLDRARPSWLLLLRGDDAEVFESTLQRALALTAERSGYPGAFDAPSSHRKGADHWSLGDDLHLARRGAFGVASNRASWVEKTLERATTPQQGMFANEAFSRAHAERVGDELAWAWVDLGSARDLQRLAGQKRDLLNLAEAVGEPGAQMLLGPGLASIGGADSLSAGLALESEDLVLRLLGEDIESGPANALRPRPDARETLRLPRGKDNLLEACVYRDLAGMFQERVELFAPENQPKFAEAESNLALFFGGVDITEAILPELGPWMGAVSRNIEFDPERRPDVPLPALALLAHAEGELGEELVAAFQTAVGLVNVDRAQKGQESLRLQLRDVDGITLTSARFRAPRAGEGVDMQHNLQPACALVGETFVVGTHAKLVAELARELRAQDEHQATATGEALVLSGAGLADVLTSNRELLVMNGVLNDGKTRAQAEGDHDGLTALADLVERLQVEVDYPDSASVRVAARLDVVAAGASR